MSCTPLPWRFKDCEGGAARYALWSAHEDDALIYLGGDRAEDNKRLLEALPQMVQAIRGLSEMGCDTMCQAGLKKMATAALRAAGLLEPELKPCPFGSGHTTRTHLRASDRDGETWWQVTCGHCRCSGPIARTKDEAAYEWNRRAGEP